VREALRVLQAMGIIEMRPGKGAYLKTKQGQDESSITQWFKEHEIQLQDFMEIRLSLEPLAVRLAIERGTEEEIEEIEEVFHNFEEAQKKNDAVNMAISDEAFHTAIMKATHNKLLMIISQNIAEAFTEYRTKSFAEKKTAKDALEPHRGIIRAIKDRNVREAQKQMKKHIEISLRDIKRVVEEEE
jgi:GntR family transcriptional repressor for pyruvate dehydrogenase complex